MYLIRGLMHRTDISLGRHGFSIDLSKEWKSAVAASDLTQERVDHMIKNYADDWMRAAGFGGPLFAPQLRVSWGEWGPEHITVPGNACGLDIDRHTCCCLLRGGVSLTPHNIDSLHQKYLLLMMFTQIAEYIACEWRLRSDGH